VAAAVTVAVVAARQVAAHRQERLQRHPRRHLQLHLRQLRRLLRSRQLPFNRTGSFTLKRMARIVRAQQ